MYSIAAYFFQWWWWRPTTDIVLRKIIKFSKPVCQFVRYTLFSSFFFFCCYTKRNYSLLSFSQILVTPAAFLNQSWFRCVSAVHRYKVSFTFNYVSVGKMNEKWWKCFFRKNIELFAQQHKHLTFHHWTKQKFCTIYTIFQKKKKAKQICWKFIESTITWNANFHEKYTLCCGKIFKHHLRLPLFYLFHTFLWHFLFWFGWLTVTDAEETRSIL